MSKFLKVLVNSLLILAIVVAGGLLIPPFAGVTTVIVDDGDDGYEPVYGIGDLCSFFEGNAKRRK